MGSHVYSQDQRPMGEGSRMGAFVLCAIVLGITLGILAGGLDPNPPHGIDCDWCRYWESVGETL